MNAILRIQPKFFAAQAWIESLGIAFLVFLILGAVPLPLLFLPAFVPYRTVIVVAFLACCFVPMAAYVWLKKANYEKTFYEFDENRIRYYDGFFNIRQKEVLLKSIIEVNFGKNILQRQFDVGTIFLNTAATGQMQNPAQSGVRLRDIPHPEQYYEQIRDIVHKKQA